ncbi:CRISPR-associated helicase/endonuclease Cas3 [Caryophanon tenue]|uniref:CRISPR-associated helicase/endonuclease Cas3 n=1 Tax=Caryophanon tenue TaxID=33978 RepID=A0A1C0YHN8_9BACL|nr:CRISPR-associated helicase/endonuclease Cas3 [Caryophanon tenue]OCS86661.1 hypothetical protein A6M13_12665 [Caryophanon tenue]
MLDVPLFDIKQIKNIDQMYAHTKKDSTEKELLGEHLHKTLNYFQFLYTEKKLASVFNKLAVRFFKDDQAAIELWEELAVNAIYLHDIGKINGNFQKVKMQNNQAFHVKSSNNANHSMLSAVIYYNHYFEKIKNVSSNQSNRQMLLLFLVMNSYVMSKHHGNFDTMEQFFRKFEEAFGDYQDITFFDGYTIRFQKLNNKLMKLLKMELKKYDMDAFIYIRLLYSCLCAADYYATGDFLKDQPLHYLGTIKDVQKYRDFYENGQIYQSIEAYRNNIYPHANLHDVKDINILRTELFIEAEQNLQKHQEQSLFYVEAPTGGGKTNISINLGLKLLQLNVDLNKIVYVFPFNTLVEQTYKTLQSHFDLPDDIAMLNSITPMLERVVKNEEQELSTDFEQTLLDRQFLHYPIVLTSHVNLFSYLFGVKKESIFALAHLANSVIILDEIQSYRNLIWKEIIQFLKEYAEILNIKVIIMSATLPRLGQLIDLELPSLIENKERYFQHPLFKHRVKFDFTLLEQQDFSMEDLVTTVAEKMKQKNQKILVEFITKKSAVQFYTRLKEELPTYAMDLLTGDDHKAERARIIQRALQEQQLVLIATQVVEAGVDIDMDIGFKNISILDAEEQFAGRINRSCKNENGGEVYFFELDRVNAIYKGDLRVNRLADYSVRNPTYQQFLLDKNFTDFYRAVFERVEQETTKQNEQNWEQFRSEKMCALDFLAIEKRMELISKKDYEITLFMNRDITLESGEVLNGSIIWQQYKELTYDKLLPFAIKKVELSKINEKMSYFLYRVTTVVNYQERIGEIFYIDEADQYFIDGKFNREALQSQSMFI